MKRTVTCASIVVGLAMTNCLLELSRPLEAVDAKDARDAGRDANALPTVDASGVISQPEGPATTVADAGAHSD
jgi:hypothetical protein